MNIALTQHRDRTVTTAIADYGERLYRFIRGRVPTTADAEDIIQDVWFQFSKVIETEPIEQVSAWLFRVARNRVTDRYRKKTPLLLDDLSKETDDGTVEWFSEMLVADDRSPDTEMMRELFWEVLFEALEELPEVQRNVFVWNELEDQTLQEIADRTDTNLKTVISRKGYAVKYLRKRLQDLYREFLDY